MDELEGAKFGDPPGHPGEPGALADPEEEHSHPLQCPWTFYYFERPAANAPEGTYEDAIHKIGKFSTCEEFWSFYSHLVRPDQLGHTISLQLFRNDSRAMWEDPENRNGGSFRLRFVKGQVAFVWEKLLLNLIGEQLPGDVVGTVVSPRAKMDLLYLWHQHSDDEALRMEIVADLQRVLELPVKTKIDYSPFDEMLTNQGQKNYVQYVLEADGPVMKIWSKQPPQ
jgi:translation initiation factor 4E